MPKTLGMRVALWLGLVGAVACIAPQVAAASNGPGFGPNVIVFSPSTPQQQIQDTLNQVATQQMPNQFGPQSARGGILSVINGTGGSSTVANPDTPVDVASYP